MKHIASFGSWKSPISSDLIGAESIKFEQVILDGSDIYWVERRPSDNGRYVIVRRMPDGNNKDMLPHPYNARISVHDLVLVQMVLNWHGLPGITQICPGMVQNCGLGSSKRMVQLLSHNV